MIQQVEEFRAELHPEAFVDADVFHQHHVDIRIMRTVKLIPARISDMPKKGVAECRYVRRGGSNAIRADLRSGTGERIANHVGVGKARNPSTSIIKCTGEN